MKTMLTFAAAAILTAGLFAKPCEGNACRATPEPAAQEASQEAPAARKACRPAPKACPCKNPDCACPKADAKRGPKDGQCPRGKKMRPDRRAPGARHAAECPKAPAAERAKALRARAAELEKRAAELEAEAAQPAAPAAE